MKLNLKALRDHLQEFRFTPLFVSELGWNNPASLKIQTFSVGEQQFNTRQVATLAGVQVFEVESTDALGNADLRKNVHREISKTAFENLIIFTDALNGPTQSLWYWVKRGEKLEAREHLFVKGQSGELFISKIAAMFVDIAELDSDGKLDVLSAARKLADALDVERVTKKFYGEFSNVRLEFARHIRGIPDDQDRAHYASVLMHRLMFVYFLQKKGFLDVAQGVNDKRDYLQSKFAAFQKAGVDATSGFYDAFLKDLFFEGFAKPEDQRSATVNAKLGHIKYLNGGLFLRHRLELENLDINVDNEAFENLLGLFGSYTWNLDDTPGGRDDEINPDVLGYIFEKYINQKAFGAYYTRPEITEYLCKQTIDKLILERVNDGRGVPGLPQAKFTDFPTMLLSLNARLCKELLEEILPNLKLLDPACGSGAFLISALKTLTDVYGAILGRIDLLNDPHLNAWKKRLQGTRSSLNYVIKRRIVTDNIFGVDLMPEATDIARLRLFLAMVSSARSVEDLEPLPNIDFNILSGNSLIGLMHISAAEYEKNKPLLEEHGASYPEIIKQRLVDLDAYRHAAENGIEDLQALRDNLQAGREQALRVLNPMLLEEFGRLKIKFEAASWDTTKNKEGKTTKRALTLRDIADLEPFHWGFEFSEVMDRGGFDAIITNPPWDVLKPQDKEFFAEFSEVVTKNKMTIKDFETEKSSILEDNAELCAAYTAYLSRFPHQSAYYRSATQFAHQSSVVNGKKTGTDINLYKLFTEQCTNLLRASGHCGIVIPSGIYTDLGAKGLREMLFEQTTVTGLFGFENRKIIFEGVDSRFKFVVLSYCKSGHTTAFPAAFMRLNVADLEDFPARTGLTMQVELIKRLSPDSMSIMEFQTPLDVAIAEKMLAFPLLGEKLEGLWNLKLTREFDMTNDSYLFKTSSGEGRLPLFEGKMMHQFTHTWGQPRYWVEEKEGRKGVLGSREKDTEQTLDYQKYRIGFRDIARNTDERTWISTVLPPNIFCGNTLNLSSSLTPSGSLLLVAILNSFSADWLIRQKVNAHVNMFYAYQLPVPRLTSSDPRFQQIVTRAARLICTTAEFDDLARSAGLRGHQDGAIDANERAVLRAQLDGIIAHLYGLSDTDFAHILTTFPIVPQTVKDAALTAYRTQATSIQTTSSAEAELLALIARDESTTLEFKSTLRWDVTRGVYSKDMEAIIVKAVAAMVNTDGGDLLIGVRDDGSIYGLEADYATLMGRQNWDGFQQKLTDILGKAFTHAVTPLIRLSCHRVDGKDICKVQISPSNREVFVKVGEQEVFYVRTNNSSRPLHGRELLGYTQSRMRSTVADSTVS